MFVMHTIVWTMSNGHTSTDYRNIRGKGGYNLVARKLATASKVGSSLGSNLDIAQKLQKGDISKGVLNTL
jgi:hypothetical protein